MSTPTRIKHLTPAEVEAIAVVLADKAQQQIEPLLIARSSVRRPRPKFVVVRNDATSQATINRVATLLGERFAGDRRIRDIRIGYSVVQIGRSRQSFRRITDNIIVRFTVYPVSSS